MLADPDIEPEVELMGMGEGEGSWTREMLLVCKFDTCTHMSRRWVELGSTKMDESLRTA